VYFARTPRGLAASVIGKHAAEALAKELGSGHIRLSSAPTFLARYLRSKGYGVADIARRLHRTDTCIRSCIRAPVLPENRSDSTAPRQRNTN
jgi:hypothetical protein